MSKVIEATTNTFNETVLNSEIPVLLDFWAPWCGPCKALNPTLESLADKFVGKAKIVKVNADDELELAKKYNVRGLPTILVFNGETFENVSTLRNESHFVTLLEGHVKGKNNEEVFQENLDDSDMRMAFLANSDIDKVRERLQKQPEVGLKAFDEGMYPITYAILSKKKERIDAIMELKPTLSLANVAALGEVSTLKDMLAKDASEIDKREGDYGPALAQAIMTSQFESAEILLKAGAKVDFENVDYFSVLACALRSEPAAIKLILEHGYLDIALSADKEGSDSLLICAVLFSSEIEVINYLLSKGFSPTTKGSQGLTPIKFAELKIEKGTDEKAKKSDQITLAALLAKA